MHQSSRPLCYTTKTGIKIGSLYEPPPHTPTYDEEVIQNALLGDDSPWAWKKNLTMLGALFITCAAIYVGAIWLLA